MARTIIYRVKAGPGALQRAVIDESALPQSITGVVNGTTYEVDTGFGTWVDVTPVAPAPTFSMPVSDAQSAAFTLVASRTQNFDLSALTTGDKVVVHAVYDAAMGTTPTLTVQGDAATRVQATNPTQTGMRNTAIFEVTLSGPGQASAAVTITTSGTNFGDIRFGVFGFKGAGSFVHNIGSYFSDLSFTRSVTPTSATNFIVATDGKSSAPTGYSWTNVTEVEDIASPAMKIASAQNVPAAALNVGFNRTDTGRGALAITAVMP